MINKLNIDTFIFKYIGYISCEFMMLLHKSWELHTFSQEIIYA